MRHYCVEYRQWIILNGTGLTLVGFLKPKLDLTDEKRKELNVKLLRLNVCFERTFNYIDISYESVYGGLFSNINNWFFLVNELAIGLN